MAKIKSYSDLQQSKVLSKILPPESADMCYTLLHTDASLTGRSKYNDFPCVLPSFAHGSSAIPCWSLPALLGVLPFIDFTAPQLIGTPKTLYRCQYNDDLKSHAYDNPIDACYEMIIKLNELNLL